MIRSLAIAALAAGMLASAPAALAQTVSALTPSWARDLLAADQSAVTQGRASLSRLDLDVAVRVTIAPADGGVARLIRFEAKDGDAKIALRRFTGHPVTGWWLWGPDTPTTIAVSDEDLARIARLAQSAAGLGRAMGGDPEPCVGGEAAHVEIALNGGPATATTRGCVRDDPVSSLAVALSDLAGSQGMTALNAAAQEELLDADRAFAASAAEEGVAAAFAAFAADDAMLFVPGRAPLRGPEAARARFEDLPEGAQLVWEPRAAHVSSRGDMGWTWGVGLFRAPGEEPLTSHYVSIWTRDFDGAWIWAADIGVRGEAAPDPDLINQLRR